MNEKRGNCGPSLPHIGVADLMSRGQTAGGRRRGEIISTVKPGPLSPENLAVLEDHKAEKAIRDALPPSVKLRARYPGDLTAILPNKFEVIGRPKAKDLKIAAAIIQNSLSPARSETIEKALTELVLVTKARESDHGTEKMRMTLYMRNLAAYPDDVVVAACRATMNHSIFFPAWSELRERLEARMFGRRLMQEAIRSAINAQKDEND